MQRDVRAGQALAWSWTSCRGYSLAEMSVVIVVLGILATIAVPVYSGIRTSSLQTAAMHSARLINAARDAYALTVPSAITSWNSAGSDAARLQLLITENLLAGDPNDYLSMAGNYSVQLSGEVRSATILTEEGNAIDY
jgi:prepilin-type N-terminal cleavage/methylation domain-containing protein